MNDIPQAVKSNLFYMLMTLALFFQGKYVIETEKQTKILQTFVNGLWIIDLVFTLAKIRLNLYFLLLNVNINSKTKHQLQKYANQTTFKGHILTLHIR